MMVEKTHEIISLRQIRWLEKYIKFNTPKRTWLKLILKETSLDTKQRILRESDGKCKKSFEIRIHLEKRL